MSVSQASGKGMYVKWRACSSKETCVNLGSCKQNTEVNDGGLRFRQKSLGSASPICNFKGAWLSRCPAQRMT
jgi:hypothetical protein